MQMDRDAELSALLTTHEFLLEIVVANMIADMPLEHGASFVNDLKRKSRMAYTKDLNAADDDRTLGILQRSAELMDNFLRKAGDRAENLRRIRSA